MATTSTRPVGGSSFSTTARREGLEQIEFKIYPDGRVEETVRGVKGGKCTEITEKINESLGKVVETTPTEEMYEAELVIEETVSVTEGSGGGSKGESFDGSSSW
jgi:hypothetical protein